MFGPGGQVQHSQLPLPGLLQAGWHSGGLTPMYHPMLGRRAALELGMTSTPPRCAVAEPSAHTARYSLPWPRSSLGDSTRLLSALLLLPGVKLCSSARRLTETCWELLSSCYFHSPAVFLVDVAFFFCAGCGIVKEALFVPSDNLPLKSGFIFLISPSTCVGCSLTRVCFRV